MSITRAGALKFGYKSDPNDSTRYNFNLNIEQFTHRTNYTIKSDAKPDETKSFDYELQFRDYWGTQALQQPEYI